MKLWMRMTAFVVAVQFLNVQINAAMGNQAMAAMTHEYQIAMAQAEKKMAGILDGMSEEAQMKFAYRVYKSGVKARNRVLKMSEEKFQKRLERATRTEGRAEDAPPTMEETALAQEVNGIEELGQLKNAFEGTDMIGETPMMTTKSEFLAKVDPVLNALGSNEKANGKLSIASKKAFKQNVVELAKKEGAAEMRAPASNQLAKILVKILIIAGSLLAIALVLAFVFVIFTAFLGWLFIGLVITGLILLNVRVTIRI